MTASPRGPWCQLHGPHSGEACPGCQLQGVKQELARAVLDIHGLLAAAERALRCGGLCTPCAEPLQEALEVVRKRLFVTSRSARDDDGA